MLFEQSRSVRLWQVCISLLDAGGLRESGFGSCTEIASGRVASCLFIPVVWCSLVFSAFISRQKPLIIMTRKWKLPDINTQTQSIQVKKVYSSPYEI